MPYLDSEISGNQIAFEYFHQDNNAESTSLAEFGADVMTFNADGSGQTARREFGFAWLIDPAGKLIVTFDNGDSNTYARFSAGFPDPSVVVGRFGSTAGSRNSVSVAPTDGSVFSNTNVDNQKFRSAFQIVDPDPEGNFGVPRFDFTFLNDGTGCRDAGFLRPATWEINPEGYLIITTFLPDGSILRFRSWQLLLKRTGHHWVNASG